MARKTLSCICVIAAVLIPGSVLATPPDKPPITDEQTPATEPTHNADPGKPTETSPPAEPNPAPSDNGETEEEATARRLAELYKNLDVYFTLIEEQEAEGGSYNPTLSETVYGLGRALQNAGHYREAINAYQRAMHINRVNNGIYSLSQAPMLRGIIESHQALNQLDDASAGYHHYLWLNVKTYGNKDPRLVPVLDEVSQWHLNTYLTDPEPATLHHLVASYNLYSTAANVMAAHSSANYLQMIHLLHSLVRTSYYFAEYRRDHPSSSGKSGITFSTGSEPITPSEEEVLLLNSYANGRWAYQQIISVLYHSPEATPQEKAAAYAELGDWYLMFDRRSFAMEAYNEAHTMARSGDNPEQTINNLFGQPKMLPVAINQGEPYDKSRNYILAEVDVSSNGAIRNYDILESHPENDDHFLHKARKVLKRTTFRPLFQAGEPVDTEKAMVKLYVND